MYIYIYLRENPEHVRHIIFSFINYMCLVVRIDILADHQPCKNQLLITEPEINTETMEVRFRIPRRPSWEETIELFCSENFKYTIILCFVQVCTISLILTKNEIFRFQGGDEATDIADWYFTGDLLVTHSIGIYIRAFRILWEEDETDPDSAILTLGGLWQSHG